jgi:hypothetical protein
VPPGGVQRRTNQRQTVSGLTVGWILPLVAVRSTILRVVP